ncbi:MAG: ATP-dependent DNA helicase RecG [Alphaproteobacteria bacterium]
MNNPLSILNAPISTLKAVPANRRALLEKLVGGSHIRHLLLHKPSGILERLLLPHSGFFSTDIANNKKPVALILTIDAHIPAKRKTAPWRVEARDSQGSAVAISFFGGRYQHLAKLIPVGSERLISGKLERYKNSWHIQHPDIIQPAQADFLPVEPLYPLTTGITQHIIRKTIKEAFELLQQASWPEWINPPLLENKGWPSFMDALQRLHHPQTESDISDRTPWLERLAYDELLAQQLALQLARRHKIQHKPPTHGTGQLRAAIRQALPWPLTNAQERCIHEIAEDMQKPESMLRLLQGDVGSGKTMVALMAMLHAIEAGYQTVLMAPTEILARQHVASLGKLCLPLGISVRLLSGGQSDKEKKQTMLATSGGQTDILIGTHALIEEGVQFQRLGLVVIDEQHRFGVEQRLKLAAKGEHVDTLVMTATPIPRSLSIALYGEMDISRLDEKPASRQKIKTSLISLSKLADIYSAIDRALIQGEQVFWVCPLVEESEELSWTDVQSRHDSLQQKFGDKVGLVHGRLKAEEKEAAIQAFRHGISRILVATTVIEVGVDVPAANIMIIEQAERYGLAQLHQLRGRVGRGDGQAHCLLLYDEKVSSQAKERLELMRLHDDGFVLAEADMNSRGAGDWLGTRQSGLPSFHFAHLGQHGDLAALARNQARYDLPHYIENPSLALIFLLRLYGHETAPALLRSG